MSYINRKNDYIRNPETMSLEKNPAADYHGGHAKQHHEEMAQIATQKINELVPDMIDSRITTALENIIGAIEYDVKTYVSMSVDYADEVLLGSKAKKIISTAIMDTIKKNLK